MKILNKTQADALFQSEAILIGRRDVIPDYKAVALFGAAAVKHAVRTGHVDGYGIGDYTLCYLTYEGFLDAASFSNVQQIGIELGELNSQGKETKAKRSARKA